MNLLEIIGALWLALCVFGLVFVLFAIFCHREGMRDFDYYERRLTEEVKAREQAEKDLLVVKEQSVLLQAERDEAIDDQEFTINLLKRERIERDELKAEVERLKVNRGLNELSDKDFFGRIIEMIDQREDFRKSQTGGGE